MLFEEFLKCMRVSSKIIITDQGPEMKSALTKVMSTKFLRLYKWHITHEIGDKLGRVAMDKFHEFLNNSVDEISFERAWDRWVTVLQITSWMIIGGCKIFILFVSNDVQFT